MTIPVAAGHSYAKLSITCDCLLAFEFISYLNHSPHNGRSVSGESRNKGMGKPQLPQLMLAYGATVAKAQSDP